MNYFYLYVMEEKELTIYDAWQDFFEWAFARENIKSFSAEAKHYFNKTNGDVKKNECGPRRIKNILTEHGKGRYQFHKKEWVTKNEAP